MPGPNQQVFEPDLPAPSQRHQALLRRSSLQRAPRAPTRRFRGIGAHRSSTPARRRRRGVQSRPGYEPHTRALTRFQGLVSAEGRHQHQARGVSIAVQVPESCPTAATVHTQRRRSRMQHIARDPRRNLPSGTCPVSLVPECDAGTSLVLACLGSRRVAAGLVAPCVGWSRDVVKHPDVGLPVSADITRDRQGCQSAGNDVATVMLEPHFGPVLPV